jgi:hypothetical protein
MAVSRDQKLFPHFGEAGAAVFAVEEVEYGGHDRTPSLIITTLSFLSGCKGDLDHSPVQRGRHSNGARTGQVVRCSPDVGRWKPQSSNGFSTDWRLPCFFNRSLNASTARAFSVVSFSTANIFTARQPSIFVRTSTDLNAKSRWTLCEATSAMQSYSRIMPGPVCSRGAVRRCRGGLARCSITSC